jgi:hypothetical protein
MQSQKRPIMQKVKIVFLAVILFLPTLASADIGLRKENIVRQVDDNTSKQNSVIIQFDGFETETHLDIEEYLVVFSGYTSHETIVSKRKYWEIIYKTQASLDKIRRNLTKMLNILKLRYNIKNNGNIFVIVKNYDENRRSMSW